MRSTGAAAGMLCPLDKTALVMSERQGIEIDYCPTCRGVWLDRGELDKIIERNGVEIGKVFQRSPPANDMRGALSSSREYGDDGYGHGGFRKGKKKSFLSEIFD